MELQKELLVVKVRLAAISVRIQRRHSKLKPIVYASYRLHTVVEVSAVGKSARAASAVGSGCMAIHWPYSPGQARKSEWGSMLR